MEINIGEIILEEELDIGEMKLDLIKQYPELESLEVTPTSQEQTFKSDKYGYSNVKVKAIESEELNIVPSSEEQIKEGMFDKVTVAGDKNLIPGNIKNGIGIFGVVGNAKVNNAKITDASYLFYKGARMNYLNEFLALCENVTNMSYMFFTCTNLTNLDLSNFDTSEVTDMSYMFYNCSNLTNLDISNFDTSKVTSMSNMFLGCSQLTELYANNFDTSKVTDMSYMFSNCNKLTNLDISNFDISKVTNMTYMFYSCSKLKNLDLSNFDTNNVTNMHYMFGNCNKLTNLDISNFDMSKITRVNYILDSCSNLTNLTFGINLGKGYTQKTNNYSGYKLNLSDCTLLTHESLMSVINNLYDLNLTYNVANGGRLYAQTLNLGSTNKSKLTEEEIAIATNKGWNVT